MIHTLADNIRIEVLQKLDEIYNVRKADECLVSIHNMLIDELRHNLNQWVEGKLREEHRINQIKLEKLDNL